MSFSYSLSNFKPFYYPDDWFQRSLHGKNFDILDGKALIRDFFSYNSTLMEWEKKTQYYCGVEGSGKTNLIRFATWVLNNIKQFEHAGLISISTNDLRIFGDSNYSYLFKDMGVVNLIGDDALGGVGTNSAEFMHGSSISAMKEFVRSRHIGKEQGNPVGIVFMTFATQSWKSLNPIIRENATLKVFTSYMDTDYFQTIFPFEETEFLRGKHHEAHVGSNWKERKYVICRTGAGGIATLEIPLVPDSQKVLDWCRNEAREGRMIEGKDFVNDIIYSVRIDNEEDFRKQETHKNKIYIIDRSIDNSKIITRLATYLRTHPKIRYLIEHHPKRNNLEDFSRGKLKGILMEEARKIEQDFCVKIKKTDLVSAIDLALKEEEFELVELIQSGRLTFEEKEVIVSNDLSTIEERLKACFLIKKQKIFHISELCAMTNLDFGQVSGILSKFRNIFINIIKNKGYWSLVSNQPSKEELHSFKKENGLLKTPMKKLEMEEAKI